jgi:hypothetical protein
MSSRTVTCSEAAELVSARELGLGLEPGQEEALEAHLAACDSCRRVLEREQKLSALVASHAGSFAEACEPLAASIAAALPERSGRTRGGPRFFRLEAAAAVLLFAAGMFVGTQFGSGPGPQGGEEKRVSGAPVEVEGPLLVGHMRNIAHELLPEDRLRTVGGSRFLFVDPDNPDLKIELDIESILEDLNAEYEYR